MTENEREKEFIVTPLMYEPEPDAKSIDSPETIVRDLLRTEKEIALETLRMTRSKYEREKFEWEKLYGSKERDLAGLKSKLDDSESRINQIRLQLEEEKQKLVEQVREKARDLEAQRVLEKKKWEVISDEIRGFKDNSKAAQDRLAQEQESLINVKREALKREKRLQDGINAKDEDIAKLKEQLVVKEEAWLKFRAEKDDEIRLLQENLAALKAAFESQRQSQGKVIEKTETDLGTLKKALQDTIIQLNIERQKKDEALETLNRQKEKSAALEDELKKTVREYEADRAGLALSFKEEQLTWEKYKKDFALREETLRRETEEQVTRILKSVEIIEAQLAEEQNLKKSAEEKLKAKDEEIRKLASLKEESSAEWRKMLASEQELRLARQTEMLGEFDKVKAAREEDFKVLRNEISNLSAGLAEENKLYVLEKEQNRQLLQKVAYLEEHRQSLIVALESKENNWRDALASEQELYKKQMEDSREASEAQLKSRDNEIARLDEDINMLNGQTLELRQNLSLEKNENNNRLERISEYESQMKSLTGKYNQERADWHKRFQFIQQQWDEQRASLMEHQKDIESRYEKDMALYNERIKGLNERIKALQDATGGASNAQSESRPAGEEKNPGRYYPHK